MSFLKGLGKIAGEIAGTVVSVPIALIGEITGSEFVQDVADGAYKATVRTGKLAGELADGTVKVVSGIFQKDTSKVDEGLEEVVVTSAKTVAGIGKGLARTVSNGIEVAESIADGDMDKAIKTGKQMLKVAAIGAVAIGACDLIDGIDMDCDGIPDVLEAEEAADRAELDFVYEEPPVYWVEAPHTANDGYWRTMPDASISNNLSSK